MGKPQVAYLIDMDGVLYRGAHALPGAQRFMERLIRHECPFMLVTNDSAPTREEIQARLEGVGIRVSKSSIYTSAMATAAWVKDHLPGQSVMLVGEKGLRHAFQEAGVDTTGENPDYLVVGEMVHLDADALSTAASLAAKNGRLIGTNPDLFVPTSSGVRLGCGAIMAMFEKVAGESATFIGKPQPNMFENAISTLEVDRDSVIVIGDNMRTDILGAHRLGLKSVLVLTGVSQIEDLDAYPFRPTWIAGSLDEVEHDMVDA